MTDDVVQLNYEHLEDNYIKPVTIRLPKEVREAMSIRARLDKILPAIMFSKLKRGTQRVRKIDSSKRFRVDRTYPTVRRIRVVCEE